MVKYYDGSLRWKLPATNTGEGVVLNRHFDAWAEHIDSNLGSDYSSKDIRYANEPGNRLLSSCVDHAKKYQHPKHGKTKIMLTHPLFLHLAHMREIENNSVRKEVDDYLEALLNFLRLCRDKPKVSVVVLETIHSYAAATSLLVEDGLIDQVIFTESDKGCPLERDKLRKFKNSQIYFGGGYNSRCLKQSIEEMKVKLSTGEIWAITDLVLNCPQEYSGTLRVSQVRELPPSRMIPLETVIAKLKGDS